MIIEDTYLGMFRSDALTKLARDKPCMNCESRVCSPDTTVWAHSNLGEHGKGKSLKAHDCFGAFLGARCHTWLDQPYGKTKDPTDIYTTSREDKALMFRKAMERTYLYMWRHKLIRVA